MGVWKKAPFCPHSKMSSSSIGVQKREMCNILLHAYKGLIFTSKAQSVLSDIFFFFFRTLKKVEKAYKFNIDLWKAVVPTGLICGDVHSGELRCIRALVGNSIDRLDFKAILCVGLQVADHHATLRQAQVARGNVHVVITPRAHAPLRKALLTDDVIQDVFTATQVTRLTPFQDQRCFVHTGDDTARGRWNSCESEVRALMRRGEWGWERDQM